MRSSAYVIAFSAFFLASCSSSSIAKQPDALISNSQNACRIISNPGQFTGSLIGMSVIVEPGRFDGPLLTSDGCPRALGLGSLASTPECKALEVALGLPGHAPDGDVLADLEGHVVTEAGKLPYFVVERCSNIKVQPRISPTPSRGKP